MCLFTPSLLASSHQPSVLKSAGPQPTKAQKKTKGGLMPSCPVSSGASGWPRRGRMIHQGSPCTTTRAESHDCEAGVLIPLSAYEQGKCLALMEWLRLRESLGGGVRQCLIRASTKERKPKQILRKDEIRQRQEGEEKKGSFRGSAAAIQFQPAIITERWLFRWPRASNHRHKEGRSTNAAPYLSPVYLVRGGKINK